MTENPYRDLPPVDDLAEQLDSALPRMVRVDLAREALAKARKAIESGETPDIQTLARDGARAARRSAGIPVINASGVLLHTNLGRARWSSEAVERSLPVALEASNLEMSLVSGERDRRGGYVGRLLTTLTGAEDAVVVNNNASALFLALASTAAGKATVVSRGELIEIGGSYRLPDVIAASGTRMVEVGTTNKVRADDYTTALQLHDVGAILKVHPSNYRVEGFTEEATIAGLSAIAGSTVLIHDIGSGLLDDSASWLPDWVRGEPGARQSLDDGADLVMFSGDKLIGGPQAGIVVGKRDSIMTLRSHPLSRAMRVDAVTYSALGATLEAYADDRPTDVPFWKQALASFDEIAHRSDSVASRIGGTVERGSSAVGGGSTPGVEIASPTIRLEGRDDLFEKLLDLDTPILSRREEGDLLIDLRAVDPDRDEEVARAISTCL